MCQFDWGVFWSAFSALATAAAVFVALWLSSKQGEEAKLDRKDQQRLIVVRKLELVASVARYAQGLFEHAQKGINDEGDAYCQRANADVYRDTEVAVREIPASDLPSGELVVDMHRLKVNCGIAAQQIIALMKMGTLLGGNLTGTGAHEAKARLNSALLANQNLVTKFENELVRYRSDMQ